ncbi:hypothetical protein [uncultured Croceitalea sp.]|uniref:hypothetical protein n=1 Tax=uncultured Croceitalea sp. TaxID=1798908 RepID=UPI00374E5925
MHLYDILKSRRLHSLKEKVRMLFPEFLMLFLAVFLGFIADNIRDGFVEKSIEKDYVRSLLKDIEIDKIKIRETMSFNEYRIKKLDTLSDLGFTYNQHKDDKALYMSYEGLSGDPVFFIPNEQTLRQLNYSSGLRLLSSKAVVRAILEYDYRKQELKRQQEDYDFIYKQTSNLGLRIFNQFPFKAKAQYRRRTGQISTKAITQKLLSNDTILINEFANKVYIYQSNVEYYNVMLEDAWFSADSLTKKIKKEYRIN